MADILREAPFGQVVRWVTRNRYFKYPEEKPDFVCPHSYKHEGAGEATKKDSTTNPMDSNQEKLEESSDSEAGDLERQPTLGLQRTATLPYTAERLAIERSLEVEKTKSRPVAPTKLEDGTILVDWYLTDDPANPQNWSQKKKAFVAFLIE